MFGGHTSSNRRSRLISASPYAASALASRKPHQRPLFDDMASSSSVSRRGSSAANTPSPAPSPSPSSTTSDSGVMSSTARLIFDTLEKMSTPVRDAQKLIPSVSCSPPRAEKRRLIAEQFDWSQNSLKRRRPHLGRHTPGIDQLNGPPLRTIFSPVPASPKQPRSNASKSARISSKAPVAASADTSKNSQSFTGGDGISNTRNAIVNDSSSSSSFGFKPATKPYQPKQDLSAVETNSHKKQQQKIAASIVPGTTLNNSLGVNWGSNLSNTQSSSHGGKIRSKLGESMHHKTLITSHPDTVQDPVQDLLAAHNKALPLKDLPVINFGKKTTATTNTTAAATGNGKLPDVEASGTSGISRTSSATTVPLYPSPKRPIDQDLSPALSNSSSRAQLSASFQFSKPSSASRDMLKCGGASVEAEDEDVGVPNGILFSFCQPKEVATPSALSPALSSPNFAPSPTAARTNFTSMASRSDPVDLGSLHKNHAALPDLTRRSVVKSNGDTGVSGGGAVIPAKSLKSGSVLDVLNRKFF